MVTRKDRVADRGDIVWLEFDPQAGHEQAGHRPALVLSPARYNALRGMMLSDDLADQRLSIRSRRRGRSAERVLADQVKCLDWRTRRATRKGRVASLTLTETQARLRALLDL